MGNQPISNDTSRSLTSLDAYLSEIPEVTKKGKEKIGVYFLKSVKCYSQIHNFYVQVKMYIKMFESQDVKKMDENESEKKDPQLTHRERQLKELQNVEIQLLTKHKLLLKRMNAILNIKYHPNIIPYYRIIESKRAIYLMRQFCYITLSERMSTRPKLTPITKKWITYQILRGLCQLHGLGFFHGDLKAENIELNGWDWVFLGDLSPFKPLVLPKSKAKEMFDFYFNTSELKTTLAPERLFKERVDGNEKEFCNKVDVFSAACVIAQLFLDGREIFVFSELNDFRNGKKTHIESVLKGINDKNVRKFLRKMLALNPKKRLNSEEALSYFWKTCNIPEYFKGLHNFFSHLLQKKDDERLDIVCDLYDELLNVIESNGKVVGDNLLSFVNKGKHIKKNENFTTNSFNDDNDDIIDFINANVKKKDEDELEKIILDTKQLNDFINNGDIKQFERKIDDQIKKESISDVHQIDDKKINAKKEFFIHLKREESKFGVDLISSLVCSSVRNCKTEELIIRGMKLMRKIAFQSDDFTRLQKLVPYICDLYSEKKSSHVKINAIRTLRYVLQRVEVFDLCEVNLFNDYFYSKFKDVIEKGSAIVRICFAENLPLLMNELKRFVHAENEREEEENKNISESKKKEKKSQKEMEKKSKERMDELKKKFDFFFGKLAKDKCDEVRISLLKNIKAIYKFCGEQMSREVIFPLLKKFSIDKTCWRIRCEFFSIFNNIGWGLQKYNFKKDILPLFYFALYDEEEFVTHAALKALIGLCRLNVLSKNDLFDVKNRLLPLIYHPNNWIKYDVIAFIVIFSNIIGDVDSYCLLLPELEPHLIDDVKITKIKVFALLEGLKIQIGRRLFNLAKKKITKYVQTVKDKDDFSSIHKAWKDALNVKELTKDDAFKLEFFKKYLKKKKKLEKFGKGNNSQEKDEFELVDNESNVMQKNKRKSNMYNGIIGDDSESNFYQPKSSSSFVPKGRLFGVSNEHGSSSRSENTEVTSMTFLEKEHFLITGSKDYSIRIWDVSTMGIVNQELNFISKLRYEINELAGYISSICCFNSNDPLVVLSTAKGWVQIFNIHDKKIIKTMCVDEITGKIKFVPKISKTNDVGMSKKRSINVVKTFQFYNNKCVFAAGQSGKIHVINDKHKKEIFQLGSKRALEEGPITAMCGKDLWVVSSTGRGYMTLWDLRFQVPIDTWKIQNVNSINALAVQKYSSNNAGQPLHAVYIATSSTDIIEWDLENNHMNRRFRCYNPVLSRDNNVKIINSPIDINDNKNKKKRKKNEDLFGISDINLISYSNFQDNFQTKALCMSDDGVSLFSGGNDRKIRLHNVENPKESKILCGLNENQSFIYESSKDEKTNEVIVKEQIYSLEKKHVIKPFDLDVKRNHKDTITCLQVIMNKRGEKKLVSAGVDGEMYFWE